MLERIERAATISVTRGVGFALLAVGLVAAGLSYDPGLALRSTAILLALLAAVLMLKARTATRAHYRRTETWLILDERSFGPEEVAQRLIGGTLQRILDRWARRMASAALLAWVASLIA